MGISVESVKAGGSGSGSRLVLAGVTVVDTATGALTPGMNVVLANGAIAEINAGSSSSQGAGTVVDARGKFLVPGFLDMHTHLLQDDAREYSAALMLAYGITGIRQMAGTTAMLRARSTGTLRLGQHAPELLSLCGELLLPLNAATPEAGVAEVRRQKAEGADFIKTIFLDPKTFFATAAEAKRQGLAYDGHLSPGVDVAAASKAGMTVIEHLGPTELQLIATSTRGWLIRLILKLRPPKAPDLSPESMQKAGRIMIANPILGRLTMDPDALTKTQRLIDSYSEEKARALSAVFVANGTWQCPTLIRNATMRLGDDPLYTKSPDLRYVTPATRQFWSTVAGMYAQKVPPGSRDTLRQLGELELKLTKTFDDAGVKMMAGSDFGGGWVIPGVSLHQEFDLLANAGLTPLRVLQMTTLDGAEFLKREATMGTVAVGKKADLVLLDRNPVESAQHLHAIHAVVRGGTFYSAEVLREIKEQVAGKIVGSEPEAHDAADQIVP